MSNRPVLIIDGLNVFMRAFCAYPQLNVDGEPMGGAIGFLKIMQRLVSEQAPSAVYVAWEGGGSQRRRSIYPEYKLNRKPMKLNRFYGDDLPEESDNKQKQLVKLLSMLKCVPICQLYVSDCEGDDVIAHLCTGPLRNHDKVIASSDKDLFQLIDDKTKVYSLHKKTYITAEDVFETFRVNVKNFAIAKALCGDDGDNVPGVKGLGFKTVSKLYPFLGTDNQVILQEVFDYASTHIDESKIHRRIFEDQEFVKRNWKLVFLDGSMLSGNQKTSIDYVLSTFQPKANKMGLIKLLAKEGMGDFDTERFFYVFNCIENLQYKTLSPHYKYDYTRSSYTR